MSRSNRVQPIAAAFAAVLGFATLGTAVPAGAAPLPPVAAAPQAAPAASDLLSTVQWGPPHGRAWGHRRHYWGGPRPYYRPHYRPYRCRTVWQRQWNPYRGYYVSRPVRRCW